jgi:hypothetical protein
MFAVMNVRKYHKFVVEQTFEIFTQRERNSSRSLGEDQGRKYFQRHRNVFEFRIASNKNKSQRISSIFSHSKAPRYAKKFNESCNSNSIPQFIFQLLFSSRLSHSIK